MANEPHNPLDHVLDKKAIPFIEDAVNRRSLENVPHELPLPFGLSLYTWLLIASAVLILALFLPLARRIRNGEIPRGKFWNGLEAVLTFIRNDIARPNIGEHDADRFVPFLWTLFLFILFCNLFGMIPFLGSPTASIAVTAVLAVFSFVVIHGAAIARHGFGHYLQTFAPPVEMGSGVVARVAGLGLTAFLFCLEIFGAFTRALVLAVRLFANMLAGHTTLAVLLMFIPMFAEGMNWLMFWPMSIFTVAVVVLLSLLELFVAFLQAFVFTLLTALFLGMALHPEH